MKLLEAFKESLEQAGEVKKVWLTTFELNMEFVEKYVLSAIANVDVPQTRLDFEAIQAVLSEKEIEVRVFYDAGSKFEDMEKKTSVPFHAVNMRNEDGLRATSDLNWNMQDGLFHPKVIYIEGTENTLIGAGSANLTLAGWGKNRECFHFEKLYGKSNKEEVRLFFQRVFVLCNLTDDFQFEPISQTERENKKWLFNSSFSKVSFLDHLLHGKFTNDELICWSPYLGSNLSSMFRELQAKYEIEKLGIVPDRHPDGKMRASFDNLRAFREQPGATIYKDETRGLDHTQRFSHAKLWLTPKRTAIGSWNFTRSATYIGWIENDLLYGKMRLNVEAGFILLQNGGNKPQTLKTVDNAEFSEDLCFDDLELENEAKNLASRDLPPFTLRICFDWQANEWSWNSAPVSKLDQLKIRFELPLGAPSDQDSRERVALTVKTATGKEKVDRSTFELKNRHILVRYSEIDQENENKEKSTIVWVEELNPADRPIHKFSTFDSMLNGLISGNPEADTDNHRAKHDEGDTDNPLNPKNPANQYIDQPSYFKFFAAMRAAQLRLKDPNLNLRELRRHLYTYPANVLEIITQCSEAAQKGEESAEWSPLFIWFMVEELENLIQIAQQQWRSLTKVEGNTEYFDRKTLEKKLLAKPNIEKLFPRDKVQSIMNFLKNEIKRSKHGIPYYTPENKT